MSKQEKGRLYESEVPKGLRFDSWDEDKEPKNKKKKKQKFSKRFIINKVTGERKEM